MRYANAYGLFIVIVSMYFIGGYLIPPPLRATLTLPTGTTVIVNFSYYLTLHIGNPLGIVSANFLYDGPGNVIAFAEGTIFLGILLRSWPEKGKALVMALSVMFLAAFGAQVILYSIFLGYHLDNYYGYGMSGVVAGFIGFLVAGGIVLFREMLRGHIELPGRTTRESMTYVVIYCGLLGAVAATIWSFILESPLAVLVHLSALSLGIIGGVCYFRGNQRRRRLQKTAYLIPESKVRA